MQGATRKRPMRPPITIEMMRALKAVLNLDDSFDACIWAEASCAFWGMMRFGEVSVSSRDAFNGAKHLKRKDILFGYDRNHKRYARLDLPDAKTAKRGEIQHVFLTEQEGLCPLEALDNLRRVVPAGPDDPLFSWRDTHGDVRPMVKSKAIERINAILSAWGWGTAFGHSFRIGGASFFLSLGINPEIVRLAGSWRSMAYETYIRAFEQVVSLHMGGLMARV
ncbi:DNA breaking-rejoining enzyme [Mycena metata]|uniref:DNA breaking-rejoining enzyme n=1 Tax=Mycena metata TaxID=1033252 RepID=A0AAD7H686_9AGAR|nr:DNA breaking-rejoining enzyme [Mycena metata]